MYLIFFDFIFFKMINKGFIMSYLFMFVVIIGMKKKFIRWKIFVGIIGKSVADCLKIKSSNWWFIIDEV